MKIEQSKQKYVGLKPQKGLERRVYEILEHQAGMLERDIYQRLKTDGAHATRKKIVAALHRLEEREVVSFTILRRRKKNERSWALFSANTAPTTNKFYPQKTIDGNTQRSGNVQQITADIFDFNRDRVEQPETGDNTMFSYTIEQKLVTVGKAVELLKLGEGRSQSYLVSELRKQQGGCTKDFDILALLKDPHYLGEPGYWSRSKGKKGLAWIYEYIPQSHDAGHASDVMQNNLPRWDTESRVNYTAEFVVTLLKDGNMNQGQLMQKVTQARNEQEEARGLSLLLTTTNLYRLILRNDKFLINNGSGHNENGLWFIHPGKAGAKIYSLEERNVEPIKETPLPETEPKIMQADHPAVTELRIRTKDKLFFVASLLLAVATTAITFSAI